MGYQLENRHFKYFLTVAEDLHFRKAAERLYISQPGLSKQIKELEDNLGVKLFDRHNRRVELTPAGNYLQIELRRHFVSLDRVIDHAKLIHDGLEGELRFGFVGSAMQEIIPEILLELKANQPKVLFRLQEMDNQLQIDNLLANEIDIGFVRMERMPRGLKTLALLSEPFYLVLPHSHYLNESNFKGLDELKDEHFILFDPTYSPSYHETVMNLFFQSGFTPLVTHNTIHAGSIYTLVAKGFGLSVVPKSLAKGSIPGVKFIALSNVLQRTVLSAVWSESNRNPMLYHLINVMSKMRFE